MVHKRYVRWRTLCNLDSPKPVHDQKLPWKPVNCAPPPLRALLARRLQSKVLNNEVRRGLSFPSPGVPKIARRVVRLRGIPSLSPSRRVLSRLPSGCAMLRARTLLLARPGLLRAAGARYASAAGSRVVEVKSDAEYRAAVAGPGT